MLDVFNDWASDEVKTADELAGQTGAENLLIGIFPRVETNFSSLTLILPPS